MPPILPKAEALENCFKMGLLDYLEQLSTKLGGDILPLKPVQNNLKRLVSNRAIDYELMRSLVQNICTYNALFHPTQTIEAFATLDAIGKLRGHLIQRQGDVMQIDLLDTIGEMTVALFKLPCPQDVKIQPSHQTASGSNSGNGKASILPF